MEEFGSVEWVSRTGGRMTFRERLSLAAGMVGAVGEGFRLRAHARRSAHWSIALATIEPPETPIVNAARAYLASHCAPAMVKHCFRTGFWTMAVLHQHTEVTEAMRETAWVAALLHDVGLEQPPAKGDFTMGGVELLISLAREHGWSDEQTRDAGQAIATNLCSRVDPAKVGVISWAMNVGGLGELGFPLHRAQWHPDRITELERIYERTGLRETSSRLIKAEAKRVPGGRFAFFQYLFPLITKG